MESSEEKRIKMDKNWLKKMIVSISASLGLQLSTYLPPLLHCRIVT